MNDLNKNQITYCTIKRIPDILFGLIGCILLIPLTVFVKILYLVLGDNDEIFFVQNRIGIHGKEFPMYKFRTMVINADNVLEDLLRRDKKIRNEYKKNKKIKKDPRVTRGGAILRRFSIDEFPQFINILRGEMSLIGNRPYLPREKKDIGKYYKQIVKTKPGLTGYWQVYGKSDPSFSSRCKLEAYYSNNFSLPMDTKIFFKTFLVILEKRNSN